MTEAETIDATIHQVERLYQSVTGREAPPPGDRAYAPIPPEKSPEEHVDQQIDRLSDALKQIMGRTGIVMQWTPPVAIWESPGELRIWVDLPGVAREAVNVSTRQGLLEIEGERSLQATDGREHFSMLHCELPRGTFRRVLPIPAAVQSDQIRAQLRDGVLEIRAPKPTPSETKKAVPVG